MKLRSIPSPHVHGSRLAEISNSRRVRLDCHVCLVRMKMASADLSKRQYENNFQESVSKEREALGSKTQAEKVGILRLSEDVRTQ